MARLLTWVGDWRGSMGPPIITMLRGCTSPELAMSEMAANARAGQEAAEAKLADLETRLAVLEARVVALETAPKPRD